MRLHCAFLGCPVAGDKVYGRKQASIQLGRHFLHAWKLRLQLPSEQEAREFTAELPAELDQTLVGLRAERGALSDSSWKGAMWR